MFAGVGPFAVLETLWRQMERRGGAKRPETSLSPAAHFLGHGEPWRAVVCRQIQLHKRNANVLECCASAFASTALGLQTCVPALPATGRVTQDTILIESRSSFASRSLRSFAFHSCAFPHDLTASYCRSFFHLYFRFSTLQVVLSFNMALSFSWMLSILLVTVQAHMQLYYPPPFNASNNPQ